MAVTVDSRQTLHRWRVGEVVVCILMVGDLHGGNNAIAAVLGGGIAGAVSGFGQNRRAGDILVRLDLNERKMGAKNVAAVVGASRFFRCFQMLMYAQLLRADK